MRFICLLLALILGWISNLPHCSASDAASAARALPFPPGEKLVYELRWTVIPAGFGTLEVMPSTTVAGQSACHFRLQVRTNEFVDAFYRVRDEINGYTDKGIFRSMYYHKKQQEGRHHRDEKIRFDWDRQTAHYTNFGKPKPAVEILPGTFDPMSVLYFVRRQDLQLGATLQRPVTDGKKCIIGKARVVGRETITVPAGTFDTWRVIPELEHIGGVFRKSPNARLALWITADENKWIIRLKSKVVVGSFLADLLSIQQTQETKAAAVPTAAAEIVNTQIENQFTRQTSSAYRPY